ncbi:MAG: hypothetical protein GY913_32100 [Proteobacteria bacterium]|nr:hypothetical protein [Pseudomonadota bacterium]MCP4921564.1 hypothetical protein [Pseudomonadota bacterium]
MAPRFVHELDEHKVPWTSPPDFAQLGWEPGGDVGGAYWVELSADGREFEVHGMIDADGDGIPQHFRATRTTNATLLTPNDVY